MIEAIEADASQAFTHVTGNRLVRFVEGIDRVAIGPVTIARTAAVAEELRDPSAPWRIVVGERASARHKGTNGDLTFGLPEVCWVVRCRAARRNLDEQSAWITDVAISLLRLAHHHTTASYPSIGEIEAHPRSPPAEQAVLVLRKGDASWGGAKRPGMYEVDDRLAAVLAEPGFCARVGKVFEARQGTVGERVALGLGWLTRGRTSGDRAERLLHAFTALEALLSRSDKTAPVVQTIARHAAVMLWREAAARAQGAREIRRLYDVRSALVHTGTRNVTQADASTTQWLVELLFWQVLDRVSLDRLHNEFCEELAEASYGGDWPPA